MDNSDVEAIGSLQVALNDAMKCLSQKDNKIKELEKELERTKADCANLRSDLLHINEYWNGAQESAVDAIEHARSVAYDSLAANPSGQGLLEELKRCREAANALKDGIAHYKQHYQDELDSCDRMAKWCEENKDTHGMNFHQGLRGGLVDCDIALTKFFDTCNLIIQTALNPQQTPSK